jgi:hypothetical protein
MSAPPGLTEFLAGHIESVSFVDCDVISPTALALDTDARERLRTMIS